MMKMLSRTPRKPLAGSRIPERASHCRSSSTTRYLSPVAKPRKRSRSFLRMTVSELRTRWGTPEGRRLASEASAWLLGKTRRIPKGLGAVDGRTDLRGFPLHNLDAGAAPGRRGAATGVRWKGIDFRYAVGNH